MRSAVVEMLRRSPLHTTRTRVSTPSVRSTSAVVSASMPGGIGTSLSRTVEGPLLHAASQEQAQASMIAAVRRIDPIKCSRRDPIASATEWHEDSSPTHAQSRH